ncbi:EamA family transporter [Bordetella genomosp. 8]|uniref:EamA family transporter n=1 Tax=Bordetella genomosp. 8 TaxID=1416806 RepID=A0A1W6YIG4_9BORD|nr:DMT family transporter [Bordetella genomosp. 8]ARP80818.1 EamA family transporter [Bordetella genomosp. 8]
MDQVVTPPLSRRYAGLLFALVILSWGLNWTATKIIVHQVTPLWTTAIRCAIASGALFVILVARGQLIIPKRGDLPVVLAIAMLHMVAFSTLVALGLKFVPVGRSIVLGYTTPLWVMPGAWLFLREKPSPRQLAGIALGLVGLALLFNPWALDWRDAHALFGNGVILLAAFFWAANILYVRAHRWVSTPFQLVFWQTSLASCVLSMLAFCMDGAPQIAWSPQLAGAFLFAGLCGTALAYWAMAMVNRSLPAVTTSLGLLATPVVGIASSVLGLGESIGTSLAIAMVLILGGIALGTPLPRRIDLGHADLSTRRRA